MTSFCKHKFLIFSILLVLGRCNSAFALAITNDSLALDFQHRITFETEQKAKIKLMYDYGAYLDEQGDQDEALRILNRAFDLAQQEEMVLTAAEIGNYLAAVQLDKGDLSQSTATYLKALELAKMSGDSSEIAKIGMNIAGNYNFCGKHAEAIKYGLESLRMKEAAGDWERICYHYIAISNIFKELGNNDKREYYVLQAYKLKDREQCASKADIANIYNSLGGIAEENGKHEEALAYYDTLQTFCAENHFIPGVSAALINSSLIYMELGKYEDALSLVLKADSCQGATAYDSIFSDNCKAEIFLALGEYSKALRYAQQNINRADLSNYSSERLKCLQFLRDIYAQQQNFEAAYKWSDSLRTCEAELDSKEVRKHIEELETRYQTEKKEHLIELLTAENRLRERTLWAGTFTLVVLLVLIALILYVLRIRKKQALLVQADLRQQILRAQMSPHFIFNVLGSIQNFMLLNESKKAANYLAKFASLTRATLEYSSMDSILLRDELDMLMNYLELEKMRKPDVFDYQIDLPEELEFDFISIPPMMIQPFLENAIKHGFKNIDRKGELLLSFEDQGEALRVVIQDNGVGLNNKTEQHKSHRSMAMDIFFKRKKLIEERYQKRFGFELVNLNEEQPGTTGVKVVLIIPILND